MIVYGALLIPSPRAAIDPLAVGLAGLFEWIECERGLSA